MADKIRELVEQFRTVFAGRGNLIDSIVPPLLFVILNALWSFEAAVVGSLGLALALVVLRLARGQSLGYTLSGVGGVLVAILVAVLLQRAEGFFLPNMITGALTVVGCLVSVLLRRPLVAWTSHLARGWPLDWYWHPRVRPAYGEVTLAWAAFFILRLGVQWLLFRGAVADVLAVVNVILGWPATIVLLVISYLYGTWRLRQLGGPGVEEFERGAEPPWEGQKRGF